MYTRALDGGVGGEKETETKQILFAITEAEYYLPAATLRRYVAPRGPKPPPAEAC